MWSVLETIENGMVCVAASPAVWVVDDHILHWPPGIANRGVISDPQPDWTRHMCRVLRTNIGKHEYLITITISLVRCVTVFTQGVYEGHFR